MKERKRGGGVREHGRSGGIRNGEPDGGHGVGGESRGRRLATKQQR